MSGIIVAIIVIAVIVVIVAMRLAVWRSMQRKKTEQLQTQFGSEYDRAVAQHGKDADSVLGDRQKKIEQYDIRPLSSDDRARFTQEWQGVQSQFVDQPGEAVTKADLLIREVMTTAGYPAGTFDQREEAASVRYPDEVENYRQAHQVADAQANGSASTEDLRRAMVLYRSLFGKLVGMPAPEPAQTG